MVQRLLGLPVLSMALWAHAQSQGPKTELGDTWITVSAQEKAPSFRFQIKAQFNGFHLHVLLPPGTPADSWALHQWTGDPRMVVLRQKHLTELREAAKEYRELKKDPNHADEGCQGSLEGILDGIKEAYARFRDYDPFHQSAIYFAPGKRAAVVGLEQAAFDVREAEDKSLFFATTFGFQKEFDVAAKTLPVLGYELKLVPVGEIKLRPVKEVRKLPLPEAWTIESRLAKGQELLDQLHRQESEGGAEFIYRAGAEDGFKLFKRGSVTSPGCFGVEGLFQAPDIWRECPGPILLPLPDELEKELKLSFLGTDLVIEAPGWGKPTIHNLRLSGDDGEVDLSVLDAKKVGTCIYLLLNIRTSSRPSSPSGYCGAGEEVELVWMRLRHGGVLASNSETIESCLESQSLIKDKETDTEHTWRVQYFDHSRKSDSSSREKLITYSRAHPERGLWVEEDLDPSE